MIFVTSQTKLSRDLYVHIETGNEGSGQYSVNIQIRQVAGFFNRKNFFI